MDLDITKLSAQAVKAALDQNWEDAIELNLTILDKKPNDIATLNRLSKAYEKIGNSEKAKKTTQKVLKIDRFNSIAQNNLQRLKTVKKKPTSDDKIGTFSFIEEPGKTKTTSLTRLAPKSVLANLEVSQKVTLKPHRRRISIFTENNTCVGSLSDDLSQYLIRLMKLGNKYEAAIKNITKNEIEIFIRETHRSKRLKGLPSFPLKNSKSYYSLLPTDPISEVPLEIPDPEA